jgi:CubicO group peptidase (beta-lactamase class C family)
MRGAAVQTLLEEGVAQGVFPSAQATVFFRGQCAFQGTAGGVDLQTPFDLASLTKVICTTSVFMSLWNEGKLAPETTLDALLPDAQAARYGVTLEDLLYHRAGLPAFVPYFAVAMQTFPQLLAPRCPAKIREKARRSVVSAAKSTGASETRGVRALYSDVGFLLLGEALAAGGDAPLDDLFEHRVRTKLKLPINFRRLSTAAANKRASAPTGRTRPREPAPGQEGLWSVDPQPASPGEVDDDNAWAMDGVAGHAGLFGTASDVATFGQILLEDVHGAQHLARRELWQRAIAPDRSTPGSSRALGFDTVERDSPPDSSAGKQIGRLGPGALGHLGFTGVSLWIDLARMLVVALCTNRTLLGRGNLRIRSFRPAFHDRVVEELVG